MSQLTFKFPFKTNYFEEDFYVSANNFSAYKLIESWPKWSSRYINIDRNIDLIFFQNDENKSFEEAIVAIKKEITQIWKEQNLIDVNTPSFLDFFLKIKQKDDYLKFKFILDSIDIIETYSVLEMTSSYSKIRIKYRGKVNKIKDKLSTQKINIRIVNNIWKIRIN